MASSPFAIEGRFRRPNSGRLSILNPTDCNSVLIFRIVSTDARNPTGQAGRRKAVGSPLIHQETAGDAGPAGGIGSDLFRGSQRVIACLSCPTGRPWQPLVQPRGGRPEGAAL